MAVPAGEVFIRPGPGERAEEAAERLSPPGSFYARLDGAALGSKAELLPALAEALRFPAYFGNNWDALLDCLRSLPEFNPAPAYVIIISGSGKLLSGNTGDLETFREIAAEAASFLREKCRTPLIVVLG